MFSVRSAHEAEYQLTERIAPERRAPGADMLPVNGSPFSSLDSGVYKFNGVDAGLRLALLMRVAPKDRSER